MKKLLFALPLCFLIACGSGESKAEGETKSEYFDKFKFADDKGLEGSILMGQTIEEVAKNHKGDEESGSDTGYVSYERKLGSTPDADYASYFYSFDEETGKLTYSTIDIYPKDKASAKVLFDDIVNTFNKRFGNGKSMNSEGWSGTEWAAQVGGVPTSISVENAKDEDYGWIIVTFSED